MTTTSEQEFKNNLKDWLEYLGFHVQRHEDKYETGIADLSYGAGLVNGWIETKWIDIRFEKKQPLWLSKRAMTGGFVWVIVGEPGGCKVINWRMLTLHHFDGEMCDWVKDLADLLCDRELQGRPPQQHDQLPPGWHRNLQGWLHPE